MSQPNSRAARRRNHSSAPPPPRDPMRPVYIAAAVLVAAIIGVFALIHWQQSNEIAAAWATPSPNPQFTGKPIALVDRGTLGAPAFPNGDTAAGGNGAPVDGIECAGQEYISNSDQFLHIHPHLALFVNGKLLRIPAQIGLAPVKRPRCIYWIHTHDATGIIHIEAPQIHPPNGTDFTLGMFFDVWGETLARDNVAGRKGPVVAYINGSLYDGDLRAIPLKSHQQVVLEVGSPTVAPPNYAFPPND